MFVAERAAAGGGFIRPHGFKHLQKMTVQSALSNNFKGTMPRVEPLHISLGGTVGFDGDIKNFNQIGRLEHLGASHLKFNVYHT